MKRQTTVQKTIHRKQQIEQYEPNQKPRVEKKIEDIKKEIRSFNMKNRQYNGQKNRNKRTFLVTLRAMLVTLDVTHD